MWGYYGDKPPCEHLVALRAYLEDTGITIWSEHAAEPAGWVNINCPHCQRTHQTVLQPPWLDEDE
jgi:hypothetical protein